MTFTGRIRLYLLAVAVVPPLLIMLVIYSLGQSHAAGADRDAAQRDIERFRRFEQSVHREIGETVTAVTGSPYFQRAVLLLGAGRPTEVRLDAIPSGLDFLEILDSDYRVLASYHRTGLLGERIPVHERIAHDSAMLATVEYDRYGPHAALVQIRPVESEFLVYSGRYLDESFVLTAERLINADVRIVTADSADEAWPQMDPERLYTKDDSLQAVLLGGSEAGFYLTATFYPGPESAVFGNLTLVAGLTAVGSMILALVLGVYITGRAKREFENLIEATGRVAGGDLNTPVMAHDEGEFSQLADSFTEMTIRLKEIRQRLSTTEKIAAWQSVGRKIAHEVKNPLTPIAISTDDLRRSFKEQREDFPKILEETTVTIKKEVTRLTRLLDEFVRFARMQTPQVRQVKPTEILDNIEALYRKEIETGRVQIESRSKRRVWSVDPEALQQVLVNLIKNGLEAAHDSQVRVAVSDHGDRLRITIEDTGPGFPEEILKQDFEPYVSTKEGGSGLGLVISQRIVHDHGGAMEAINGDHGARITILLPMDHG